MDYAYESKYKRWAWGAVIGLVVIVIIAAIIIAATLSAPKPNKEVASTETGETSQQDDEAARKAEEERKAEEARQAEEARKAEEARQAEEARKAEEARRAEAEAKSKATPATSIPKTGPEEMILPIMALAISGYLVAYNVALFKKNA